MDPNTLHGGLAESLLERKVYVSKFGGRVVDDKQTLRFNR